MAAATPQRTRATSADLDEQIVDAARRLLRDTGEGFTIQQLVEEAGVALQTFYRHFASKDQLLLAVLERTVSESCAQMERATASIDDPVARLRYIVTRPLRLLQAVAPAEAQLTTREHFRLQQLYPDAVARATDAFAMLVLGTIEDARVGGLLVPPAVEWDAARDAARDAWMVTELVMTTFHHYAFTGLGDGSDGDAVIEHLWRFCFAAIGGRAQ